MLFDLNTQEREIFSLMGSCADELNYDSYVVGGYVRDRLLGLTSQDIDVVAVGSFGYYKLAFSY